MKTLGYSICVLICCAVFIGCAPIEENNAVPPPTITQATYIMGQPNTILITGEFFKIKSDDKKDVIVSLNGRNWQPAKAIGSSSPTSYTADIPYGIDFPEVWVRVYGINEEYSDPCWIKGQR
jgi:hypothetical protein